MMDLKFKISKVLLFVEALIKTPEPNIERWVELQDKLWEKYKTGYQLLLQKFKVLIDPSP